MSGHVREVHQRGVHAISSGRPAEGARLLRAGLRAVRDPALEAKLLISLAAAEVQLGHHERGFELLDRAEEIVAPPDRAILLQQRGLLLMLVGRMEEAVGCLDAAIPLISAESDPIRLAKTLLNRSFVHDLAGRVRQARADLEQCERLAAATDQRLLLAQIQLNRGYSDTLVGDIPAALRVFGEAKRGFAAHAPALLPVLAVDRARALLCAGLADEAAAELDAPTGLHGLSGTTHERAEAELTRAQIAVAQGDLTSARWWARRAEHRFRRRGNESWAAIAVLTRLRADLRHGRFRAVADAAPALANRLRALGLRHDAEVATLTAARACTALGRLAEAKAHLSAHRCGHPVLELILLRRLACAELRMAIGDRSGALARARAGLAELSEHRRRFGSVDLQTGTTALGVELARIGLADSLRHGRPATLFAWLERTRAQAFRLRPVRPSADQDTVDAVAELRRLATLARTAELAGRRDLDTERRCAALERDIRARGWQATGASEPDAVAGFRATAEELGDSRALASFLTDRDRLRAVVIADGGGVLVDLGGLATVTEAVARLRGDLDALCGRVLRSELVEVITRSIRHQLTVLTENLIAPLRPYIGDSDLVVVPTGPLFAIPWGLLPDLRGRPVTVTPSASAWMRGRHRVSTSRSSGPLLVAGPDLAHASTEVRRIASILSGSTVLDGADATVPATLQALDGRQFAHFAAHGHHEPGNVLFSRLDLVGGPLMAYDIHQLSEVPEHVVLSSCDVGRTVVRAGDEMLGFTAALLYGGTRTVVASLCRVADDAAVDVMAAYHAGLTRGVPAPRALAEASLIAPLIPFVCFGS
jgi:tetratricopeptide (TPR) repeat protein